MVPGIAAVVADVVVTLEDPVGEPVLAQEAPDDFDRVQLRRPWRQGQECDVLGASGGASYRRTYLALTRGEIWRGLLLSL